MLFTAGLLVARRGLFGHRDPTVVGGVVAGALAASLPALLAVVMSLVELRGVFVALNAPLLAMLTFHQSRPALGAAYLLVLGAVLGGAGALLPAVARPHQATAGRRADRDRAGRHAAGADSADPRQQPGHQAPARPPLHLERAHAAGRGDHLPGGRRCACCCGTSIGRGSRRPLAASTPRPGAISAGPGGAPQRCSSRCFRSSPATSSARCCWSSGCSR